MFAAFFALSVFASTADEPKLSEAAQKEVKKLEGKWKAVKAVTSGLEETPEMDGAEVIVEFKERKVVVNGKEFMEIAALDPLTDPKCLDLKALIEQGQIQKGNVFESIYRLDGDDLILAIHIDGERKRPAKSESEKDSGVVLVTFKRERK